MADDPLAYLKDRFTYLLSLGFSKLDIDFNMLGEYTFDISNQHIVTKIPEFPEKLEIIHCNFTSIRELPPLPPNLVIFNCEDTKIKSLPSLPSTLKILCCANTQITELPPLPAGLEELYCAGCPLVLQRKEGESISDYEARWRIYREEKASRLRCQERCRMLEEDLIAEAMHPRRIEKILNAGGFEALECF
jgi:hypothetical protein